jgi:hypothetical protein
VIGLVGNSWAVAAGAPPEIVAKAAKMMTAVILKA